MAVLESSKARTKEKYAQLKLKVKQTVFDFTKEKNELEATYQQQVDYMFFYGYRFCMKKHGITNDVPRIPSDKEDEVVLRGGVGQGDGSRVRDELATIGHEDLDTAWDCCYRFSLFWSFKPFIA